MMSRFASLFARCPSLSGMLVCLAILFSLGMAISSAAFAQSDVRPNFSNYEERRVRDLGTPAAEGAEHPYMSDSNRSVDPVTGITKNSAFANLCAEGSLTERITTCIKAIVVQSLETFLTKLSTLLQSYTLALITLAVTVFGANILTGSIEKPGDEAFMLLLKIGGVLLFTGTASSGGALFGGFLDNLFGIMETFAGFSASYMSTSMEGGSSFIQDCGGSGDELTSIWAKFDCIMMRLFVGDPASGMNVGLIWVLAGAVFWTSVMGPFVVIMFLVVFGFLSLLVIRCMFLLLVSYMVLALLVAISPLIIPLLLFKKTAAAFDGWLRFFMAVMIQPMVLVGFMVFVFATLDAIFFKDNPYSLTSILGPNWENAQWGAVMPDTVVDNQMSIYQADTGRGPGDPEYEAYKEQLSRPLNIAAVGNVNIVQEQLINFEFSIGADAVADVPVAGKVVELIEDGLNAAGSAIQRTLIPFVVPRIEGQLQTAAVILMRLMVFSVVSMILLYLLLRFSKQVPELVANLAGMPMWAMPGTTMPVERQVMGATKGAVEGAKTGAQAGGWKGALAGAAAGAAVGAATADKQGNPNVNLDFDTLKKDRGNPTDKASKGGGKAGGGGGKAAAGGGKAAAGGAAKGGASSAAKGVMQLIKSR